MKKISILMALLAALALVFAAWPIFVMVLLIGSMRMICPIGPLKIIY